ncbi:MAG: response regulator [Melioribacteraceae bacterium]
MLKFLIIDDDKSNRHLINHMLKKNFECNILEAENGQVGLNLLINNIPDSMPVMDGLKMLEIIRANQILKNIPVIVITALSDGQVVSNLAEKGICDYLLKPIEIDDSVKRIQKIINKKNAANGKDISKIEEHILIVDEDTQFKSFFKSLLGNQYSDNEVSIYLLVDDLTKLSTKVFIYNGIIKRTLDKDLFLDNNAFLKNNLPEMQAAEK